MSKNKFKLIQATQDFDLQKTNFKITSKIKIIKSLSKKQPISFVGFSNSEGEYSILIYFLLSLSVTLSN